MIWPSNTALYHVITPNTHREGFLDLVIFTPFKTSRIFPADNIHALSERAIIVVYSDQRSLFFAYMDKIKLPYFELDLCKLCSSCGGLKNLFFYF